MRTIGIFALIIVGFSAISCQRSLSPEEYADWWNENKSKFVTSKELAHLKVSAGFIPYTYYHAETMRDANLKTDEALSKVVGVELRFEIAEGRDLLSFKTSSESEVNARLNYFQKDLKSATSLMIGDLTISCMDIHVQRTSGVTPYTTLLLYFNMPENFDMTNENQAVLEFYDGLFNNGIVKLRMRNLDEIPRLKYT